MLRAGLVLAVLALAAGAPRAVAGDAAGLEFLGFSRDASHLAFEQYGIRDGSGFPYSEVFLIDVARNRFRASAVLGGPAFEGRSLESVRQEARRRMAAEFARVGLTPGRSPGFLKAARPVGDVVEEPATPADTAPAGPGRPSGPAPSSLGFEAGGRPYTLLLRELPFGPSQDCPTPGFVRGLELQLHAGLPPSRLLAVLQKDTRLPASRFCAFTYRLAQVRVLGKSLAVFVAVYRTGFEGPDRRWMVVTGRLP